MTTGNQSRVDDDQFDVPRFPRRRPIRLALAVGLTAVLAVGSAACGSDGDTSGAGATEGGQGGAAAQRGERLARSNGCAGCHGQDFGGGAGPGWVGLAGSEVVLVDGTTLVADDAYLTRAIAEPAADLTEGYNLKMPANNLTDAEIADIVAYINTLADG